MPPERQIRALFNEKTIRVYQAYSAEIANSALRRGTFQAPPFKLDRMTWIKPSFLWMMYRSGWGFKEKGQERILGIDISIDGFNWALNQARLSKFVPNIHGEYESWKIHKPEVRVQWDPERDLMLEKLDYRSLQMGLSRESVRKYVNDWIIHIEDLTDLSYQIFNKVKSRDLEGARSLLPIEKPFPVPDQVAYRLLMS